jgi:hypothetical protein
VAVTRTVGIGVLGSFQYWELVPIFPRENSLFQISRRLGCFCTQRQAGLEGVSRSEENWVHI